MIAGGIWECLMGLMLTELFTEEVAPILVCRLLGPREDGFRLLVCF